MKVTLIDLESRLREMDRQQPAHPFAAAVTKPTAQTRLLEDSIEFTGAPTEVDDAHSAYVLAQALASRTDPGGRFRQL